MTDLSTAVPPAKAEGSLDLKLASATMRFLLKTFEAKDSKSLPPVSVVEVPTGLKPTNSMIVAICEQAFITNVQLIQKSPDLKNVAEWSKSHIFNFNLQSVPRNFVNNEDITKVVCCIGKVDNTIYVCFVIIYMDYTNTTHLTSFNVV